MTILLDMIWDFMPITIWYARSRLLEASSYPSEFELHLAHQTSLEVDYRRKREILGQLNSMLLAIVVSPLEIPKWEDHNHYQTLEIRRQLVSEQGFYCGISLHKMGRISAPASDCEGALDLIQKVEAEVISTNALDSQRELSWAWYYMSRVERQLGKGDADTDLNSAWKLRFENTFG